MGADILAENTPISPEFICPICLTKPKKSGFQWKKASLDVDSPCCLALQCNARISNLLFLTQRKPDSAWWSMHQRSKETKLARRRLIQGRTFSDFQFLAKKFYTETPIRLSNCKTVGRSLNFLGKVVNKEDYLLKPIWAKKLRWEGLEGSIHWHCSGLLQVSRKHAYRF